MERLEQRVGKGGWTTLPGAFTETETKLVSGEQARLAGQDFSTGVILANWDKWSP